MSKNNKLSQAPRKAQPSTKPTLNEANPRDKVTTTGKQNFPRITGIFARYFVTLLIGVGNLYVIYKILTPLTVYILSAILSIFTDATLYGNTIHLNGATIEIVSACVAGSAFYLLLLLLMLTADIKPETRAKAITTSFAMLFALNILRMLVLIPIMGASYFGTIHWISWHVISTIFVVGIWISIVKIYKIKTIPVYSDIKYIISLVKTKKPKRKKKHK